MVEIYQFTPSFYQFSHIEQKKLGLKIILLVEFKSSNLKHNSMFVRGLYTTACIGFELTLIKMYYRRTIKSKP